MGTHEGTAGFPSAGERGEAHSGAEYACGSIHNQPGERGVAGGLLPEQLAF